MRLDVVLQLTVDVLDEAAVRQAARRLLGAPEQAGEKDWFADEATSTTPAALSVILANGLALEALQAAVHDVGGLAVTGLMVDPLTVTALPPG